MPRRHQDRKQADVLAHRIGERVRAARDRQRLTQEELAERVGVTSEALGRIERADSLPSFPTFVRLCEALGLTPDGLLVEARPAWPSRLREREAPAVRRLRENAQRLDERERRLVLDLVRALARK